MNTLTDSIPIQRYHQDMIALHGNHGSAAQGWRDDHSQTVRFEALAAIADLNGHSILDAGCGHGDLRSYLQQFYPDIDYTGVDHLPEFLKVAERRYQSWPSTRFIAGNFMTMELPVTDYILASGSLNYKSTDPDFIFKAISTLYSSCRLGLAFNLLSFIPLNGLIVAYDPEKIKTYCESLSKRVVLKADYDDEDFTVFMYR